MITWMRKNMRVIMITVIVIFAASIFYGIGVGGFRGREPVGRGGKRVLAKVNGKEISPRRYQQILSRLAQNLGKELGPQEIAFMENLALSQAVDFELMLSEAKKQVRVPRSELDAALNNIMQSSNFSSQKELEAALKRMGTNLNSFKNIVREDILVQKLAMKIQGSAQVAPEDLREIAASHILVSQEAQAQELLSRIKKGESFSKLAQLYSLDPGSKVKGGDLGYFTTGTMVAPFEKAAFGLKIGEVSEPVKTQFGYHIVKVTDSRLRKFSGKEKDLEKAVLAEKQERVFRAWYSQIRNKAKVEIVDPVFRGHAARFSGRLAEALAEYKKALQQYPTYAYVYIYLGDIYEDLGKSDLALAEYEKAVEIEGGNPALYILLGNAYKKQGKREQAIEQYKKASLIAGDSKALHEKLRNIFKELKASKEYRSEETEIARIEKKEKFEKELKGEK